MNVAEDADMLDKEAWLAKAKALPVGRQDRIYHGREKRPNLVIGNDATKWWAYCQACKEGGVVDKEHVRLEVLSPEAKRSDLSLPFDMQPNSEWAEPVTHALATFLSQKGMDLVMLPPVWYSASRKRLLMQTDCHPGWLGRDVTGTALEKWLTYNGQRFLLAYRSSREVIVVEDPFSYYKVQWATTSSDVSVMCALGTGIKPSILRELLGYYSVVFMFDGDSAGSAGALQGMRRLRALGKEARCSCAPLGYDPKDLTAAQIRNLITGSTT